MSSDAVQLKDEGNALFVKKQYAAAILKYTDAIALDDKNAVLFGNRAACHLALKKWMNASEDAHKATEFDPNYAKGWGRLAAAQDAMSQYSESTVSWRKAIDVLPSQLSSTEAKQKEQYEDALKDAKRRLEDLAAPSQKSNARGPDASKTTQALPWQVAKDMLPKLKATGQMESSAWVIASAYDDWKMGIDCMNDLKFVPAPLPGKPDRVGIEGYPHGTTCLTNGILRDPRVFHTDNPKFLEQYSTQVTFERESVKAYIEDTVEDVIKKALKRQQEEGWVSIRAALSITVRAWIMQGFITDRLYGEPEVGANVLKNAIDLLNWGRKTWKGVPDSDRGTFFSDSFLLAVRSIYLGMRQKACSKDLQRKALTALYSDAQDLLEDAHRAYRDIPAGDYGPDFIYSFYTYPQGHALAIEGFCLGHIGDLEPEDDLEEQKMSNYLIAADRYNEAAMLYPEDDEYHAWYLSCSISYRRKCHVPIPGLKDLRAKLRAAEPKMREIWMNSQLAKEGRDAAIQSSLGD